VKSSLYIDILKYLVFTKRWSSTTVF